MPTVDPYAGKTLGNTRLIERLGQGAMGMVYRGYHLGFRKDVAVKMLLPHIAEKSDTYRERFLREGQAAASVRHPNVVQIIDAGQDRGIAYLVMELIDGPSLGRLIDARGALPSEAVIRLGIGIARGLAAIHAAGIIHRDIKPDNILVGSDAIPKITDLGLAKQHQDADMLRLTATGVVVGTPLYVSPEAIRDPRTITPASDLYSLGATLYHLVTGQVPYNGSTAYEVMRGHLEQRLRPVHELNDQVPAGLAELIERCLAKQPDKRPSAERLAELLASQGRARAGLDRRLVALVALVAVAVMTLGGTGFAVLGHRHASSAAARDAAPGRIALLCDAPRLRARVDGGAWTPVDGALTLPAGSHQLVVEAMRTGATLQWQGAIEVVGGANRELPVPLATVTVPSARLTIPGVGMLFRDGVAFGEDGEIAFTRAGTYAVSRCTDAGWANATVVVDAHGAQLSPPSRASEPSAAAYWRAEDERGRALTRHHVACWWEVERARARGNRPSPIGWREQGQQPEQAAVGLNAELVGATAESARGYARLPDRAEALRLAREVQASLWCSENGRLDVVGDAAAAQVALLPVRP